MWVLHIGNISPFRRSMSRECKFPICPNHHLSLRIASIRASSLILYKEILQFLVFANTRSEYLLNLFSNKYCHYSILISYLFNSANLTQLGCDWIVMYSVMTEYITVISTGNRQANWDEWNCTLTHLQCFRKGWWH